jgi:hypothetical protein
MVIKVGDDGTQGTQTDVAGAGAITNHMTPPSHLGGASVGGAAEAAGTGAAEHQHPGDRRLSLGCGGQSGFQIIGCQAGHRRPDPRNDAAQAVLVRLAPGSRHADADC